ncbi:transposase [Nonomuraea sp. NBC_00507]|uniref:transposase n=1 Tax=Nonomuraea sp. NBC_00507 TaxID=2976002 RepID=UPI003FA5BF52
MLAFLHTGITNTGSEGTNHVIKITARDAHGFRNPENQRLRTRCTTTHAAAETPTGFPLVSLRHRLKRRGDGRDTTEVRSGFPGRCGPDRGGDRQVDR